MHNVAKERFHLHRQRKRMWEANPPPSPSLPLHMWEKRKRSVKIGEDKTIRDFRLRLAKRRTAWRCHDAVACDILHKTLPFLLHLWDLPAVMSRTVRSGCRHHYDYSHLFCIPSAKCDTARPALIFTLSSFMCQLTLSRF